MERARRSKAGPQLMLPLCGKLSEIGLWFPAVHLSAGRVIADLIARAALVLVTVSARAEQRSVVRAHGGRDALAVLAGLAGGALRDALAARVVAGQALAGVAWRCQTDAAADVAVGAARPADARLGRAVARRLAAPARRVAGLALARVAWRRKADLPTNVRAA